MSDSNRRKVKCREVSFEIAQKCHAESKKLSRVHKIYGENSKVAKKLASVGSLLGEDKPCHVKHLKLDHVSKGDYPHKSHDKLVQHCGNKNRSAKQGGQHPKMAALCGQSTKKKNSIHERLDDRVCTDKVRKIVQEEGRAARNLVTWNVPLTNQRRGLVSGGARRQRKRFVVKNSSSQERTAPSSPEIHKKPADVRARYWAFLFENLHRAVDEIYVMCETDESELQCKEAIMTLDQCIRDFQSLIDRFSLLKKFETTRSEDRPSSLAWEVRKSSPGKLSNSRNLASSTNESSPAAISRMFTWADRVRGTRAPPAPSSKCSSRSSCESKPDVAEEGCDEDSVGWEIVQKRSGRLKNRVARNIFPTDAVTSVFSKDMKNVDNQTRRMSLDRAQVASSGADQGVVGPSGTEPAGVVPPTDHRADDAQSGLEQLPCGSDTEEEYASCKQGLDGIASADVMADGSDSICGELILRLTVSGEEEVEGEKIVGSSSCNLDLTSEDDDEMKAREIEAALSNACVEEATLTKQLELSRLEDDRLRQQDQLKAEECHDDGLSMSARDWNDMNEEYDEELGRADWCELMGLEPEGRLPGHAVQMHEKLSSPSRRKCRQQSLLKHEAKQAKAAELRENILEQRAERQRVLSCKVQEVHQLKEMLQDKKREMLQRRLARAQQKRQLQLQQKVKKAHEEEEKANEIAFINTMGAENKKLEIKVKYQESQARLLDIQEERQRRHDEKLAKEAAVEERRKLLETERLTRLKEMQDRRRLRENVIELKQQEKEKERFEAARVKEKEREERKAALNAQQAQHIEDLQRRILQKQTESTRRHQENLMQIREKAFEMTLLRHSTEDHNEAPMFEYQTKKYCDICSVVIPSEVYLLSHVQGKRHIGKLQERNGGMDLSPDLIGKLNLRHILDASSDNLNLQADAMRERRKSMKKRCKKLRQRLGQRSSELEFSTKAECDQKSRLQKLIRDAKKRLNAREEGRWGQSRVSGMDRALGELLRLLQKASPGDQSVFRELDGFTVLGDILALKMAANQKAGPVIPERTLLLACSLLVASCDGHVENCCFVLGGRRIIMLVDILSESLMDALPEKKSVGQPSSFVELALLVLTTILASLVPQKIKEPPFAGLRNRMSDVVSYVICMGIVDQLGQYLGSIKGPLPSESVDLIVNSIGLLLSLIHVSSSSDMWTQRAEDNAQMLGTLEATELCGVVSLMYGLLLHSGAPQRERPLGCQEKMQMGGHISQVTVLCLGVLNSAALLDINMLQRILSRDGVWLQFRHISAYLLWHCQKDGRPELLQEAVLAIGHFAVRHPDNQLVMQSGQPPTVLQQLCSLPFSYFSDRALTQVLFPTLVACCFASDVNTAVLKSEMSPALLANFIQEKCLEIEKIDDEEICARLMEKGDRMHLLFRLPRCSWQEALQYFAAADALP